MRRLLRHCLAKDPKHRLHDIADARLELEDRSEERSTLAPEIFDGNPRSAVDPYENDRSRPLSRFFSPTGEAQHECDDQDHLRGT